MKLLLWSRVGFTKLCYFNFRKSSNYTIKIGNVSKNIIWPKNLEFVPSYFLKDKENDKILLKHIQWMMQKDLLGQDMFLMGPPGSYKRRLAMSFAELTKREIEYISLSRDTTESDIKQRREIIGSSAVYIDQSALRAAINGRLLILDGVEKAERNVLPILNNLLENREMQLEDGRFLMRSNIYDNLLQKYSSDQLEKWRFLRCSPEFRVIALGLPVPQFRGNPLDPPLRSRFQARHINGDNYETLFNQIVQICPKVSKNRITNILSFIYSLQSKDLSDVHFPYFPLDRVTDAFKLLNIIPEISDTDLIESIFPYNYICTQENLKTIDSLKKKFKISSSKPDFGYQLKTVCNNKVILELQSASIFSFDKEKIIEVKSILSEPLETNLIYTNKVKKLMADLILSNQVGDFCVIGAQGSGKSIIVETLAKQLGAKVTHIVLYGDMTSRDLLQQRETDSLTGDTIWRNSSLVRAALEGDWAVLGGLHRLEKGCMAVLNQLIGDRQLQLFDGSRLIRHDRFEDLKSQMNLTDKELNNRGIHKIHENFRIIGLGELPLIPGESNSNSGTAKRVDWLSPEIMSVFKFHFMPQLSLEDERHIILKSVSNINQEKLDLLLRITEKMKLTDDPQIREISQILSVRQLLRISQKLSKYPNESVINCIKTACLSKFLPKLVQETLNQILVEFPEKQLEKISIEKELKKLIDYYNQTLHPNVTGLSSTNNGEEEAKIPDIVFYDSHEHSRILLEMLQNFNMGYEKGHEQQHLLLIGNQGVGKNKITDRFLQLLNRPREYIQLHRDTTVQTLTLQPSIKDGRLIYDDSPLVKAISKGYILVVDEADKASTQVTCILKNLLTLGDMELSDGRRILSENKDISSWSQEQQSKVIRIHPQFRMIVLANRPGFPFLGNDFFGAMGDVFSCHSVDNPDVSSEIEMLQKYGPSVAVDTIKKLVFLFSDLRDLADQGQIQYPYSTREIVNIVKHLEKYPNESISSVLSNVFDFDVSNQEMLTQIENTLEKHGISLPGSKVSIAMGIEEPLPPMKYVGSWKLDSFTANRLLLSNTIEYHYEEPFIVEPNTVKVETQFSRSRVFSELDEYISIKLGDYNIISDMITSPFSLKNGQHKGMYIHFATLNPMELTTLRLDTDDIGTYNSLSSIKTAQQLSLSEYFPAPQGSFRPQVRLSKLPSINDSPSILFHEACSNNLLRINPISGEIMKLNNEDMLPEKKFRRSSNWPTISSTGVKQGNEYYEMYTDWSLEHEKGLQYYPFIAFHQPGNKQFHIMNTTNNEWNRVKLDFPIRSIFFPSPNDWIVYDMNKRPHQLTRCFNTNEFMLHSIKSENAQQVSTECIFASAPIPVTNFHTDIQKIWKERVNKSVNLGTHHDNYCEFYPKLSLDEASSGSFSTIPRPNAASQKSIFSHKSGNCLLKNENIIINTVDKSCVPKQWKLQSPIANVNSTSGYLEVINLQTNTLKYLKIPSVFEEATVFRWLKNNIPDIFIAQLISPDNTTNENNASSGNIITMDSTGCIHKWSLCPQQLLSELDVWKKGIGAMDYQSDRELMIERLEGEVDTSLDQPKHGKIDPNNAPHVGGNTWAGGTGGRDTAGLGGIGGPYRLDAGHDVFQVPDSVKSQVPEHVKAAAKEIASKAWEDRLKQIKMSPLDHQLYMKYYKRVEPQINSIKVILDSLQAVSKERQWLRHQTHGDLDDGKLVEGVLGERTIYRARGDREPESGAPQQKPKRLRLLVDVSGSMYRFNGHDQRMERQMEAVLMLMEAFTHAPRDKLIYEIYGHSGEGACFPFVNYNHPPGNEKERMDVIGKMLAHSQFCVSGDHTIEALHRGLTDLKQAADTTLPVDQSLLILLSDANLSRYGIPASSVQRVLNKETNPPTLQAYLVFIGSLAQQAHELQKALPPGRSFLCLETEALPSILSSIFQGSLLNN